ncbi:hypothetical protein C4546_02480 [Candidatus Parcubacteria bacterium]|jgi:hypothetical protein|nr:MAG: hypothetical protein C4546_02480 [Candidatus Parcubacteria bacterium]
MASTNLIYKILPSIFNILITFLLAAPFYFLFQEKLWWKIAWLTVFLLYNLVFEIRYNRCLGMILFGTRYDQPRKLWQKIVYSIFYTLSFSTLLFFLWFPFDLLMVNLIFIQLPFVLITQTTFHGFISGNIKTIK